ncbi:MAG TPA: hypothetical protein DCW44_04680 [Eubacterium sp.]|nr:hypothetical protein [Eubacterium sp.]
MDNQIEKLEVSNNKLIQGIWCSVNLKNNPKLSYLDCHYCNIKNLDISNNPLLRYVMAFINPFKEVNIGDNPYLLKTYKEGVYNPDEENTGGGRSWTLDYGGDNSTGGDNIFFLCIDGEKKVKLNITSSGKAPVAEIEYAFAQLIEVCKWPHYDYKTYIKNAIAEYKKYATTVVNVNTVVEDMETIMYTLVN